MTNDDTGKIGRGFLPKGPDPGLGYKEIGVEREIIRARTSDGGMGIGTEAEGTPRSFWKLERVGVRLLATMLEVGGDEFELARTIGRFKWVKWSWEKTALHLAGIASLQSPVWQQGYKDNMYKAAGISYRDWGRDARE
jgi:hypothetical protein